MPAPTQAFKINFQAFTRQVVSQLASTGPRGAVRPHGTTLTSAVNSAGGQYAVSMLADYWLA